MRAGKAGLVGAWLCLLLWTPAAALAQSHPTEGQDRAQAAVSRPAWAVEGMPDTVRVLVEASSAAGNDDQAKAFLVDAERLARAEALRAPDDVPRRYALAVVLGLRADREGGKTKIQAASDLHGELLAILERDPEHARARHMLGRLHAGVRRMNGVVRFVATRVLGGGALGDASWEEAERHLDFAERHAPEVPDHHLQLARLYHDTGRPALAQAEVEHVLALPAVSPMEQAAREEALELKQSLEGGVS